ncbi:glycosyl transferase [Phocaeicola vulgatus]|uniref:glycosyl transferase n=1 Tax=Phocaeicola vulgatus TaxID=821 RepID=UPI001E64F026|nr:glycosyl transferase [Phocaeicola vulgatus]
MAPVIIFAFNRLDALINVITSLLLNEEAQESDLFVFVDGAREGKVGERELVCSVCRYIENIVGFKSVNYTFSETNKGLGNSVIKGVTEVINRYGKAIVLEDDLILAPNFLFFMNQGLDKYKEEKSVFSICGYSNKVKVPKDYSYDTYFCTRSSSWGWATWADRWNSVDWELENFDKYHILKKEFNRWGGSDCWKMLNDWKCGRNKSWAIRFCFAQFLQKKFLYFLLQVKCKMMVLMGKVQIVSAGVVFVVYLITRQKKSLHIRKMCLSIHSYFVLLLVIIPS